MRREFSRRTFFASLFASLGIACVVLCTGISFAIFVVPDKPTGYINDYAMLMTEPSKQALETKLSLFTASTSNEITVVTIPSLGGDTIERYASTLFCKMENRNKGT